MISAADVAVGSEAVGGSSWGLLQDISAVAISRLLPWEYSVRNLFRRPLRTMLTLVGLTTVLLLVLVVVGFIRGLESSLEVSGDPDTAIVFALGMGENLAPALSSSHSPQLHRPLSTRFILHRHTPQLPLSRAQAAYQEGQGSCDTFENVLTPSTDCFKPMAKNLWSTPEVPPPKQT